MELLKLYPPKAWLINGWQASLELDGTSKAGNVCGKWVWRLRRKLKWHLNNETSKKWVFEGSPFQVPARCFTQSILRFGVVAVVALENLSPRLPIIESWLVNGDPIFLSLKFQPLAFCILGSFALTRCIKNKQPVDVEWSDHCIFFCHPFRCPSCLTSFFTSFSRGVNCYLLKA